MRRGDSDTVTAAVTLDQSAPADQVLRRTRAADEPGLLVSCRVQARLTASQYEFDIDERRWVERSLLTTQTARWSWYVTPKVGGTQTLVLNLRPIMKMQRAGSTHVLRRAEASNVEQYETTVHVDIPWAERPQETMSRLAATFRIAEGLVKALTLLVIALLSFGAVLGVRKRSKGAATA